MSEEAKAVQEVAKAASNAVDVSRELGGFVGRYVRGPVEEALGILHDKLVYVRWERKQRLIQRADEFKVQAGLIGSIEPMPLNVAVPLLTAASIEEDDYLQDEWAKLLVNSVDPSRDRQFQKSFVHILSELTLLDAKTLRAIVEAPLEKKNGGFVATALLPDDYGDPMRSGKPSRPSPPRDVAIALYNLLRLGLVDRSMFNHTLFDVAAPTPLAQAFVRACTIP